MYNSQLVSGEPGESEYRAPKLNHKKSRFGCQRCRQRRVKCNEAKPTCKNCERHHVDCFYDRTPEIKGHAGTSYLSPPSEANRPLDDSPEKQSHSPSGSEHVDDRFSETRERRLLEAKLMHQYLTVTGPDLAIDEKTRAVFATQLPELALESDALMYSMYALTAVHAAVCNISGAALGNINWREVHLQYMGWGVREHINDVKHIDKSNVEAVCLTSHLVRICAFASMRIAERTPYCPPLEWLETCRMTHAMFDTAWKLIQDDADSLTWRMMRSSPVIYDPEQRYSKANLRGWEYILERDTDDVFSEPWDQSIQEAYETTVSYIGGCVATGTADGIENLNEARRRLMMFPMFVTMRFVELAKEYRPRALVTLAHYFAVLVLEPSWCIGPTPLREVQGIAGLVSGKWRRMLEWPLAVVEKRLSLRR